MRTTLHWAAVSILMSGSVACSKTEEPVAEVTPQVTTPEIKAATSEPAPTPPSTAFQMPTAEGKVFFVGLKDGDAVKGKLTDGKVEVAITMGVEGVKIQPAGEVVLNTGHHHIVVDGAFIKEGDVVPMNATHLHFGKGQTETMLMLEPGEHTLTLQLADGLHRSYGQPWSAQLKITVAAEG